MPRAVPPLHHEEPRCRSGPALSGSTWRCRLPSAVGQADARRGGDGRDDRATIDFIIPVYNEGANIASALAELYAK